MIHEYEQLSTRFATVPLWHRRKSQPWHSPFLSRLQDTSSWWIVGPFLPSPRICSRQSSRQRSPLSSLETRNFGYSQLTATKFYADNLACVAMSENQVRRKFSHHVGIHHYFFTNSSRPISSNSFLCVHVQWWSTPLARVCLHTRSSLLPWGRRPLLWSFCTLYVHVFFPPFIHRITYVEPRFKLSDRPVCHIPTLWTKDSDKLPFDHLDMKEFVGGPSSCKRSSWAFCGLEQTVHVKIEFETLEQSFWTFTTQPFTRVIRRKFFVGTIGTKRYNK